MEKEEVEQVYEDSQPTEINIIPVQLVEPYETVTLHRNTISPTNSSNIVRGKYYKQTYRPAWELMPDFKGWLRGVEGQPTRAYCTYCQKTLHAHRLSLLKHTCTIRHQKAAQLHSTRQNRALMEQQDSTNNDGSNQDEDRDEIEYQDSNMEEGDQDSEHEQEDDEEDGDEAIELPTMQFSKLVSKNEVVPKAPISTNVVDSTRGLPISGLQVSLYKLIDGRWTYINEGVTNSGGKCSQFIHRDDFTPGRYKLHYDVDRYFEAKKQDYLYPFIEIVFDSSTYSENYNIPLLLGPFGYTTYRG